MHMSCLGILKNQEPIRIHVGMWKPCNTMKSDFDTIHHY